MIQSWNLTISIVRGVCRSLPDTLHSNEKKRSVYVSSYHGPWRMYRVRDLHRHLSGRGNRNEIRQNIDRNEIKPARCENGAALY